MAKRDLIVRLEDIRSKVVAIESIVEELGTIDRLNNSEVHKLALERAFEIIGEALFQVQKANPEIFVTDISKIVSLRHLLAHDYFKVRHDFLWAFATGKLQELKVEVIALIDKENMKLFGTSNPNLD